MNYTYSVIIPCYDAIESDFRRCLDSIKNQTLQPIEVICVDDFSPIETPQIAKEYGYTYIRHTENKQNGGARNTGIRMAQGDYLIFVNSDDYILSNMIEVIDEINKGEDVIFIGYQGFGASSFYVLPTKENTPFLYKFGIFADVIHICNRKFYIENDLFQEEKVPVADRDWGIKIAHAIKTYNFLSKAFYKYQTGHPTSLITKITKGQIANNLPPELRW